MIIVLLLIYNYVHSIISIDIPIVDITDAWDAPPMEKKNTAVDFTWDNHLHVASGNQTRPW